VILSLNVIYKALRAGYVNSTETALESVDTLHDDIPFLRGPFEKFADLSYYCESELCGCIGGVEV
jgi:hypothetical protein